jgi:hypothetical protein
MVDPRIILLCAAIYGGVWITGKAVDGVKHARVKVEHVVKATGSKIGHGLKHVIGK